jgi:thimet oligopeptidase
MSNRSAVRGGTVVKPSYLAQVVALALCASAAAAQEIPKSQPSLWSTKPDVAAFEKTENDRLAAAQAAIDQIVAVKGPRTIENTLVPYDEAIRQLNTAAYLSTLMQQVHPDAAFRDHATAMTTKVSGVTTSLSLNQDVYHALASLDVSGADAATRYYLQRQLLEFRLAGVDKDEATRNQLKKLNDQLTEDQSMFDRNISDDQKTVEVSNASELQGLPQDYVDNHKPGANGKIQLTTNYPDVFPVLQFAQNDKLRRSLYEAFNSRAYPKNREVLRDMMQTRYQIAKLVGYASWADYNAADKMMANGNNIARFIEQLNAASRPTAQREFEMLLAEKQKTNPGAKEILSYEGLYFSELVRRSQFNFDSQSVRPYLPYKQVKQGILDTAATLFRVGFRQEVN